MHAALFYIFSAVMLVFGLLTVTLRNPVSSALSLVVSFLGLAALFVSLNAYFIGVIQILVYAGAVMVLFLFIIMLLDLKAEKKVKFNPVAIFGGAALVAALILQLIGVLSVFKPGEATLEETPINYAEAVTIRGEDTGDSITADLKSSVLPDVKLVGEQLFTDYHFHLQVVGVLLLVATVGVVTLSKRDLK